MANTDKLKSLGDDHMRNIKLSANPFDDAHRERERLRNELFRKLLDNTETGSIKIQSQSGLDFARSDAEQSGNAIMQRAQGTAGSRYTPYIDATRLEGAIEYTGKVYRVDGTGGAIGANRLEGPVAANPSAPPVLHTTAILTAAIEGATIAEHARIMSLLQDFKPRPHRLTHGDWARGWREEGAAQLWAKIMAALGEGAK